MIPPAPPQLAAKLAIVRSPSAPPAASASDTSATREVIAEGSAAIGTDGIPAARKAAIAQAMRNAVQQVAGVYISAQTLTKNYRLVRDQVVTHADGYATPGAVLRETVAQGEVSVTVRVRVAMPALAQAIRSLQMPNLGRIHLSIDTLGTGFLLNFDLKPIEMTMEKTLTDAGFTMVSTDKDADISVKVLHEYTPARPAPVTRIGTARGQLTAVATRPQTGEVLASLATKASVDGTPKEQAFTLVRDAMTANLAPRLQDLLIAAASSADAHVRIEAGKFGNPAQATQFTKALAACEGVSDIRSLLTENGNSMLQCTVRREKETDVALALEEAPAFRPFHLKILTATPFCIVAGANGVAPVFSAQPPQPLASTDIETVVVATPEPFREAALQDSQRPPRPTIPPIIVPRRPVPPAPRVMPTMPAIMRPPNTPVQIYDDLSYTSNTNLVGANGGVGWATPWTQHGNLPPSQVIGKLLTYPNLRTTGGYFETGVSTTPNYVYHGDDREWKPAIGVTSLLQVRL